VYVLDFGGIIHNIKLEFNWVTKKAKILGYLCRGEEYE